MSKRYRHIAPYDLPEHIPDDHLWDKIEDSLDEIEASAAYNSLPVHKPKKTIWANIESTLNASPRLNWTEVWYRGVAIIFILAIFFVQDMHKNTQISKLTHPIENHEPLSNNKYLNNIDKRRTNKSNIVGTKKNNSQHKVKKTKSPALIQRKTKIKLDQKAKNKAKLTSITLSCTDYSDNQNITTINKKQTKNRENISREHIENFLSLQNNISLKKRNANINYNIPKITILEKKCMISYKKYEEKKKKMSRPNLKNLFYELHYSKEIIAHNYSFSDQRKAKSLGVEFGYKINPTFFLQTGLNLYLAEDLAYYKIDYLQNEVVRTYMKTDHIIYSYDPITGAVEKTYVNYEAKEYDSVFHSTSKNTLSKYTYLRFPLSTGYQYQYSKLSIAASLGAEFSALIQGKEPRPSLALDGARVLEVSKTSNPTYSTDWYILAGLSMMYPINNYIKLKIESQYRGGWNAYAKTQTTNYMRTYSISIKTSLLMNF